MSEKEMKKWAKLGREFIKNNPRFAAIGRRYLKAVKKA